MAKGIVIQPPKTGVVLTPGANDIIIPAGKYTGFATSGKVSAVNFNAAKVLADTTIAGTQGTMVDRGSGSAKITTKAQQVNLSAGYYSGGTIQIDPDEQAKLIPENIKSGINIMAVTGSLMPRQIVTIGNTCHAGTLETVVGTLTIQTRSYCFSIYNSQCDSTAFARTSQKVDLTPYSTCHFVYSSDNTSTNRLKVGFNPNTNTSFINTTNLNATASPNNSGVQTVNISGLSGQHHILFGFQESVYAYFYIHAVILE